MKNILLVLVFCLVGIGGGLAAGWFLRPTPEAPHGAEVPPDAEAAATEHEYVKMSHQFIVPLVTEGRVSAMVVLALSLEVTPGASEAVFAKEPKLRDSFLQILFDHANSGGFRGSFTEGTTLIHLRKALLEAAQKVMSETVSDVLITDIARQDA
ncbi:flagellar basal body-associated FliL family protein [Gemmobacter fulvus]|uniref:flagellar basal body-associated FliL family protein n=1 Tax=Gemmobacter fulvus TaxID=2840474 RepID=UPI00279664BF|nr:flagellar basal body-associated FliL family protein [Gemmobacter fulvus]MDQ1848636.1 flagellar basal body-associated FliL family protein [Gemmobacter fulvus]